MIMWLANSAQVRPSTQSMPGKQCHQQIPALMSLALPFLNHAIYMSNETFHLVLQWWLSTVLLPRTTALGIGTISKCLRNQVLTAHPTRACNLCVTRLLVVRTVVMRRPKCQALESQLLCLEASYLYKVIWCICGCGLHTPFIKLGLIKIPTAEECTHKHLETAWPCAYFALLLFGIKWVLNTCKTLYWFPGLMITWIIMFNRC